MKKIVIAGSTGFMGTYLVAQYQQEGYEVLQISRNKNHIQWHQMDSIIAAISNADWVLNLAGKSVNCRYNQKNKGAILKSRIETTHIIGQAIKDCATPPKLWMNMSTATIYRHSEDQEMTEYSGEMGTGFSVDVAQKWEAALFSKDLPNTRRIALRTAIVLGKGGGVYLRLRNLAKCFLGGKQGKGNQMFSWIHIEDVKRIFDFIATNNQIKGPVNVAAPFPIKNEHTMAIIRNKLKIPFGINAPIGLLKMGAWLIGTETELVLKSRWVVPKVLVDAGFIFKFPHLLNAVNEIESGK